MSSARWHVSLRGPLTNEVRAALEHAGLELTGFGHSVSSGGAPIESHSIYVEAPNANAAVEAARRALVGLPIYVDETPRMVSDS